MPEVVVKNPTLDVLDLKGPALSTTSDMPVIETVPDAQNEGAPPKQPEAKESKEKQDQAAPPAEKQAGKTDSESATEPEDETAASAEPAKKPAKGVQKRLDELTRQREEAERRAKVAEDNLRLALEAQRIKAPEPEPKAQPVQDEDPEPVWPKRSDFSDPDAWDAAIFDAAGKRSEWSARKAVKEARAADEQSRVKAEAERRTKAVLDAYNERLAKAKEKYPDFSAKAEAEDVHISPEMAFAILEHEQGPDIQFYLGDHRDEAARISNLPVRGQLIELGLIAAQLRAPAAKAEAPAAAQAAPPKPISQAPAPAKPVSLGSAQVAKSPEDESMEEYAARRKRELQAEARPGARR